MFHGEDDEPAHHHTHDIVPTIWKYKYPLRTLLRPLFKVLLGQRKRKRPQLKGAKVPFEANENRSRFQNIPVLASFINDCEKCSMKKKIKAKPEQKQLELFS